MAKWRNSEIVKWRNSEIAKWRNSEIVKWRNSELRDAGCRSEAETTPWRGRMRDQGYWKLDIGFWDFFEI